MYVHCAGFTFLLEGAVPSASIVMGAFWKLKGNIELAGTHDRGREGVGTDDMISHKQQI